MKLSVAVPGGMLPDPVPDDVMDAPPIGQNIDGVRVGVPIDGVTLILQVPTVDLTNLYERWHGRVLSLARALVSPAEADEVAQDVFLEVWRRIPDYDPARASVWTWIHSIARSRCLDRLRTSQVRSRALQLRAAEVVEHQPPDEGWESRDRVGELLGRLSPRQRQAIELAYFDGLTHREIALKTGDPLGTVKTRLRMALSVLRRATALRDVRKAPAAATRTA